MTKCEVERILSDGTIIFGCGDEKVFCGQGPKGTSGGLSLAGSGAKYGKTDSEWACEKFDKIKRKAEKTA